MAGDRDAFGGLVRRYHRDLHRVLRRITRNLEDAEDLTQEAFLRAYRALDRFDTTRPFRPWLWTIGVRLALHSLARKGRDSLSLDRSAMGSGAGGEEMIEGPWLADPKGVEAVEARLLRREVVDAMASLDPQHRAILILRVLEEKSYEEIGAILGIPQGTVMSRLSRARMRLRERLRGRRPAGDANERSL